jgi:hypothetical protein
MTVMSIDNALVTKFSDMVHIEAQQMTSRLRGRAEYKTFTGDVFAYDSLGSLEARKVEGRNQATNPLDIEHSRRKMITHRYVAPLLIDPKDDLSVLIDPESNYAKQVAKALFRQVDRVLAEAAFADVRVGRDFDTTITAASDGVLTVDATAAGLTYEKLLEIQRNFIDNDVGTDMPENFWLTVTGDEWEDLMAEMELTSSDYVSNKPVPGGTVASAVGMDFIKFAHKAGSPKNILTENAAGTEKELICATNRGLCLGVQKDLTIRIDERPDLNYSKQVFAEMTIGAVRTEGALVQKVRVNV